MTGGSPSHGWLGYKDPVRTPEKSLVLICRRCRGNKDLDPDSLRDAVKGMRKQLGLKHDLRVTFTECLGSCPKDAVTALVVPRRGPPTEILVEREEEAASLLSLAHHEEKLPSYAALAGRERS